MTFVDPELLARRARPDPLDFPGGVTGPMRAGVTWQDLLARLAVRAARMPVRTGLIGGEYARHVAQNLAPALAAIGRGRPSAAAAPVSGPRPASRISPPSPGRATEATAPAPPGIDPEKQQADALRAILIEAEGQPRPDVYADSRKIPTVGIGHKVRPSDGLKLGDRISADRIEQLYQEDTAAALRAARAQAAEAGINDPTFVAPLASVNFQLGTGWNAGKNGHKKTWALIRQGDYAAAADEAARSDWYKQTPKRVTAFQSALRRLPPKPAPE